MIKKISESKLKGVKIIELDRFKDFRGYYQETYNLQEYKDSKIPLEFVQDDISVSKKNVLRGIHGDTRTWKIVSCLFGEFLLAVVNFDKKSDQYLEHITFNLKKNDNYQILIPPLFGNGHLVLSEETLFHYKQSTYYEGMENQFTLRWDDPKIGINWPVKNPLISERDSKANLLKDE